MLIYPFFKPRRDSSVFRFPPLGLGYLASSLRAAGHAVSLIDCTFLPPSEALSRARGAHADVVGIYCMVTMLDQCLWFARQLRAQSRLLIVGGPLPTCDPNPFLKDFDVVVRGEGEETMVELLQAFEQGRDLQSVAGIVHGPESGPRSTADRPFRLDLDNIPLPAREMFPNADYITHGRRRYGYSITTVMSSRGCPYRCEFCSNVVFGGSYRERSPTNVVDEIESALALGYGRIAFADDVFTMRRARVAAVCDEILRRGLDFQWECLGRVDALDAETAARMKQAGCARIYFGIESADDSILKLMHKDITADQARSAVEIVRRAGIQVGAFFILFYPGDTDDTVLRTLRFATSLPLDYLGLSMPYPLPGTALYDRLRSRINRDWHPEQSPLGSHVLIFDADFSEAKIWFGIIKGHVQFRLRKSLGRLAPIVVTPFEKATDWLFRRMS